MKTKIIAGVWLCVMVVLSALQASDIDARGATFPKAVYTEWMEAYEAQTGNKIHYEPTGSGDGIVSAVQRKSDFSGTDKPLRSWRLERYKLRMFPVVVGSIVLAYNIPGVQDNALGYTDFSYKQKYDLTVATLENRVGKWVAPSLRTSTDGAKSAHLKKKNNFYGIIAYPKGKTSYPIIATSFVLLPYEGKEKNKEVVDFFDWAFTHGEAIANKHGFAMLPKETLKEIDAYWEEKIL